MALGFTSHYTKQDHQFGSLILSNSETETSGSVANNSSDHNVGALYSGNDYDCCEFSVSVNIDYSQYAGFVASSGSTETAGSVAYSGSSGISTASTVSFSGGGCSSSCGSSASFTC